MLLYWDAYYSELALEREAALGGSVDPRSAPEPISCRLLTIWLGSLVAVSAGLGTLASLLG